MMRNQVSVQALLSLLQSQGFKAKVLSPDHANDLKTEIEANHQRGMFNEEFYKNELLGFDFNFPAALPAPRSLIIVACPQPQTRVSFNLDGKSVHCIIPPTYSHATDIQAKNLLEALLKPEDYQLAQVKLPLKLMAVRSGLAKYGKNNITYVNDMGSFFRLVAFYSDLPFQEDGWEEPEILELCEKCSACIKACPTEAIPEDRFLLRAERCLTYHNERQGEFPGWIEPAWHNCLVGCLLCQKICPANKTRKNWVQEGPAFSEEETDFLLKKSRMREFPQTLAAKLETLNIIEYFDVLCRNLTALL